MGSGRAASGRIPGAESGGGTPPAFRLLQEKRCPAPESPARPAESLGVADCEAGTRPGRRLPVASPAARAAGQGSPPRCVRRRDGGAGTARQRPCLRGTKVGITPSAPAARGRPHRASGGGGGRPSPPGSPDLLIKIATPTRRRRSSYLCATAAAEPPATAAPEHCRPDSSPTALKIPDKESRNSRFPTSQSSAPAPAPRPVTAVAAAVLQRLRLETARDRARVPGTLAQWVRLSQPFLGAPRPLLGGEARAIRPILSRRGEGARSLVHSAAPSGPVARARASPSIKCELFSAYPGIVGLLWH